jgi:ABC-2 type transport system ATP-binding protein
VIEFKDLRKSFGDKVVLDALTFSVGSGEVYGLLGPNGAGKTTAINILCNLLDADDGRVVINEEVISETTKFLIGVVPQEVSVYRDLTCRENLLFFARLYGLRGSQRIERASELIQTFKLNDYANTEVSKLSGGWQHRVNTAIALVHSPSVLILDEPTTGLDVEARYEFWEMIVNLKRTGVTILLTTHQLEEAERLCSRIGIMKNGQIIAEGSLDELRAIIPAKQLAVIETSDSRALCEKATSLGLTYRHYGGRLTLWLPEQLTLKALVDKFDDIPISSASLQDVSLEHVYVEVTAK